MAHIAGKTWQLISGLGLQPGLPVEASRRITTLNRLSFLAGLLILPFTLPTINPTNESFGWIEFFSFLGFASVLFCNGIRQYQLASIALILATNFKIFFNASFRGPEAGEQLYFIPLLMGMLLLFDWSQRKRPEVLFLWLLTIGNFLALTLSGYHLFGAPPELPAKVVREMFILNFLISMVISVAITFYFSQLASKQQTQIEAGSLRLTRLNYQLEEHVKALSANNQQLLRQEKALIEARDAAQAADQAKSEFLGVMSHELRTPLHALISLNQLLLESSLSSEQREYLEAALLSSENLFVIIDNLLNLSQFESGSLKLDLAAFNPATPAREALASQRKAANAKGLMLSFHLDPELPTLVRGDAYRIRHVLINLISNAIKFTSEGSVKLLVNSRPLDHQQVEICFEVVDTGIGIAPADQAQLFQPFFQIDASSTRRQGGTGLGLAICQQLTTLMGGTLRLHSKPDQGSRFEFCLPLERQSPEAISSSPPRQAAQAVPPKKVSVLLVEDNLVNQKVALRMLAKLGFEPSLAANGNEALQAVQAGDFDLILMDLQMPVMNGLEATLAIRALERLSLQPVIIALTANASEADRQACLQVGMDDFLPKPVRKDQLERVLHQWMKRPEA